MSAPADAEALPPVPGTLRLLWLLFMRPLTLRRLFLAWGLEGDPSLWALRGRLKREPHLRRLVGRFALIVIVVQPLVAAGIVALLSGLGLEINWSALAGDVAGSVALSVAVGVAGGVAAGVAFGVAGGVALGVAGGVAGGVAVGVAVGVAIGAAGHVEGGVARGVAGSVAGAMIGGTAGASVAGVAGGVAGAVAAGVVTILTSIPGPLFFAQAPMMMALRLAQRAAPARSVSLAHWLPHRWHDVINLPLPGLRGFLVDLASQDAALAARLIDEAAETFGQQRPAREALYELQARALEQAARDARWHGAQSLDLPFMPSLADLQPTDPLQRYAKVAENLAAVEVGGDQRRRLNLLSTAEAQIKGQGLAAIGSADKRARRLLQVNRVWLDAIAQMRAKVEAEITANPEIPKVYVTGPALDPRDPDAIQIFRGRRDLMEVIDHDLADDRRAALLLVGQRRMGKTSLLRMLPPHFGNRTLIVVLDFQGLSGSGHGAAPHRWVAEATRDAIADAMPAVALPSLPATDAWGKTLEWLHAIEAILDTHDRRLLIALDEVERVQTGIDEGWSTPVFLDFVRAAGDRLRHIRLLLVSAHPPARLGATWADRLISAVTRDLGPLPLDDAEGLLRLPVPDFPPEVFDDTAAQAVLAQTGGHPFLIQLVGDAVVARLNGDRRREATAKDIRRALDTALNRAGQSLFPDLWRVLDGSQQALLRTLAAGEQPGVDSVAFRNLRDLHYLVERDGEAAFAFPLFGRWVRDHAP